MHEAETRKGPARGQAPASRRTGRPPVRRAHLCGSS